MIRAGWGAVRLQAALLRSSPGDLMTLFTVPAFSAAFLSLVRYSGRADLTVHAVLAPAILAVWAMAVNVSGDIIDSDRWGGTFELLVAAPVSLAVVVFGRVLVITVTSLVAFAESWSVSLLFGTPPRITSPVLFAAAAAGTAFATAGTASGLAALFVLVRSARALQSSLTYPFYVLGGVFVPAALLPGWVHPFSRPVFLSWSADLLRRSAGVASDGNVGLGLTMVAVLGAAGYLAAWVAITAVVRRVQHDGRVSGA